MYLWDQVQSSKCSKPGLGLQESVKFPLNRLVAINFTKRLAEQQCRYCTISFYEYRQAQFIERITKVFSAMLKNVARSGTPRCHPWTALIRSTPSTGQHRRSQLLRSRMYIYLWNNRRRLSRDWWDHHLKVRGVSSTFGRSCWSTRWNPRAAVTRNLSLPILRWNT